MADLNTVAKQIHNLSPEPIRLFLSDGSSGIFEMNNTEFFQQEFQAEGSKQSDDAAYRFITSDDYEEVLVGKQEPGADEWTMICEVLRVEAASSESAEEVSLDESHVREVDRSDN